MTKQEEITRLIVVGLAILVAILLVHVWRII